MFRGRGEGEMVNVVDRGREGKGTMVKKKKKYIYVRKKSLMNVPRNFSARHDAQFK